MADRKGFLIYFDTRDAWQLLTDEQKGLLLMSIMDYSEYGVIPEFSDKLLEMAWSLMRPKLDRDAESYADRCIKNKYSVYCREEKKKDREPLDFESWLQGSNNHSISNDIVQHPTITKTVKETITETGMITETEKECKGEGETGNRYFQILGERFIAGSLPNQPVSCEGGANRIPSDYRIQTDQDFERLREKRLQMLHQEDDDSIF